MHAFTHSFIHPFIIFRWHNSKFQVNCTLFDTDIKSDTRIAVNNTWCQDGRLLVSMKTAIYWRQPNLNIARYWFNLIYNGLIYTRDGSSVWDEFGQRTIVRLIIRLRINTGKQPDHPSRRTIWIIRVHRRITGANSSERIIRLFARIYTQTNYQTNYRSLPKFLPDGWSISSINRANVFI